MYDILIIGAGITGCMTAYKLSKYNISVAVADMGHDVAWGCTRANSAIVHAGYDPEPGTKKAVTNVAGCIEMPRICLELGVKYRGCGSLVAAFSESEIPILYKLLQRGQKNGVPALAVIDKNRLRELEPNISNEAVAALWAPTAGIVCPYGLCIAAAENAAVNGTEFIFDFNVSKISRSDDIFEVESENGKKINAKYLINAAGCGADKIAYIAGEKNFPADIIPRRGEYILLDKTEGACVLRPVFSVPSAAGKGILLTPTADGNIIAGPNAYKSDENETSAKGLAEVAQGASKIVNGLNLKAVITSFAGIRPTPACEDFYIKASEDIPNLIHLAGIESPGLASSPAIASMALQLLSEIGVNLTLRENIKKPEKRINFFDLTDLEKNKLIKQNPAYGRIICRCESITEGEIIDAVKSPIPAASLDAVKRRVRAGMGRCQGGFCSAKVASIISRELGTPLEEITKNGGNSFILTGKR